MNAKRIALKVDVDTYRGTREGVPRLVRILKRHGAGATFLFSLGPDHTGRALRRVFRPGFVSKVKRTSVIEHYGLKTLLYGTLLPGPDIGRLCAPLLQSVRDAGFETGIHCWDHVRWRDSVTRRDAAWTEREMTLACERYAEVFGERARAWGAAGWQTTAHAARYQERGGFAYASDTRGEGPFLPVWNGETLGCPQLPTTLPTLDELIGLDATTAENVAARLLARTMEASARDHVYTLHAELEGGRLAAAFESLLDGWRAQGYVLVSLGEYAATLDAQRLPKHQVVYGEVPGRWGTLAIQGKEKAP